MLAGALDAQSIRPTAVSPNPDDLLTEGLRLLAQLTFKPQSDAAAFRRVGVDRAESMLNTVMRHGQATGATEADRADTHRAIAGLIALYTFRGDLRRSSVFAGLQSIYYRNENDYAAALAASRQALDLQQRSGVTTALFLNWAAVGQNLMSLGRFDEALTSLHQAHQLQAGQTTPAAANVWRNIVLADIALGRLPDARLEVDRFAAAAGAGPPAFQADARIAQSDLLMATGRHEDAVSAVRQAVTLAGAGEVADTVKLEALAQLMVCVLDAMRVLPYDRALALARRMDIDVPGLLFPIAPFAERAIHVRRRLAGEFDVVLREDLEARDVAHKAGEIGGEIEALRSMAATYAGLNSHDNEVRVLEDAENLARSWASNAKGTLRQVVMAAWVDILDSLGEAQLAAGKPRLADDAFTKAIESSAAVTDAQGQEAVARELGRAWLGRARVALADNRQAEGRDILDRAIGGAIGRARFDRGDLLLLRATSEPADADHLATAMPLFDRAVEQFHADRNAVQEVRARLAAVRLLVDSAQRATGSNAVRLRQRARTYLQETSRVVERLNLADVRWRIRFYEGMLAEIGGSGPSAVTAYRAAITELDRLRSAMTSEGQRASIVDTEAVDDLYEHLLGMLTRAGDAPQAWEYLERAKARTFLEMLHGRRVSTDRNGSQADEVTRLEQQILGLRVELAPENVSALRGSGRDPAAVERALRQLEQRFVLAREQAAVRGTATRTNQVLALRQISLGALAASVPRGAALVEYGLLPDGMTAFVVTRTGARQLAWKTPLPSLRTDVAGLRRLLADPASDVSAIDRAVARLSPILVHRVIEALPPGVDRLMLVPTGLLYYLPFQVLTTPDGSRLIDRYVVSYLPSASSLEFLKDAPRADGPLFLGALGNVSVDGFAKLPGTLYEVTGLASVEPGARLVTEQAFTRSAVVDALQHYPRVHLATHGFVDEDAPILSAIMTAPEPGRPSRLSLYDVMDLTLASRLVVLSACETGLGRLQRGDEIAGLTRTLLIAGANTVVSSLWEVSDEATALLMRGFYEQLHTGQSPAAALRAAALLVRARYPHPIFWAPFIVTGAW